jgi:hypothetical protein
MRIGSRSYVVAALLLAGCAGIVATEPPPDAMKFDAAVPAVGIKAVYRITDHQTRGAREETWTVVEASYEKRPVFGISDGVDLRVYDKRTGNWIATVRDGKERFSVSPDSGTFSWPLWVGKSWLATFAYYDRVRGRSWSPVDTWWKVTAYEDVTVPAGTFKALRLESSPGTNNATQETLWYAPDARLVVKRIYERTSGHYLGYGKFTTELVRYERP